MLNICATFSLSEPRHWVLVWLFVFWWQHVVRNAPVHVYEIVTSNVPVSGAVFSHAVITYCYLVVSMSSIHNILVQWWRTLIPFYFLQRSSNRSSLHERVEQIQHNLQNIRKNWNWSMVFLKCVHRQKIDIVRTSQTYFHMSQTFFLISFVDNARRWWIPVVNAKEKRGVLKLGFGEGSFKF